MGMGDEIMAAGRAERLALLSGRSVAITDRAGRARSHPIWDGNPAIDPKSDLRLIDCSGERPYIERWEGRRVIFNMDHRPAAGHVYLTREERGWASDQMLPERFVIVEPVVRPPSSPNKAWGLSRWATVVAEMPVPVYQLGPEDSRHALPGAHRLITPSIRHAAAVMERASIVLSTEGGMHHLAAALGIPAVVIFGAFTPPLLTGYEGQRIFAVETDEGYCGRYLPCGHCQAAMARIDPRDVARAALEMLDEKRSASNQLTAPEKALT